jgi:hypothetical protein
LRCLAIIEGSYRELSLSRAQIRVAGREAKNFSAIAAKLM